MMALEELYSHYKRPRTAILMGHARGVICLAKPANFGVFLQYAQPRLHRAGRCSGDRLSDRDPRIHASDRPAKGLKIPLWLNEGWADVYSTLRPMGKETAVGDLLEDRMRILASD